MKFFVFAVGVALATESDESCADEATLLQMRGAKEQSVRKHKTVNPGDEEFIGCFVDDGGRDLGDMLGGTNDGNSNTYEQCRAICNKRYISLQYGGECFCADAYSTAAQYSEVDISECNSNCAGGAQNSHNCGGTWRQAIYDGYPQCPAGWTQVGNFGADIGGCGLQSCGERYNIDSVQGCADRCASNSDCRGFNYAPLRGDRNHEDQTICTIYNSDTPTGTWSGSLGEVQVFCKPDEVNWGQAGGGNSCAGSDVSEAGCLAAVQSLLASGQNQGRSNLVAGSWGWVPPGCSAQTHYTHGQNGDYAAHYNRGNGNNDGGYTKVCNQGCQHLTNMDVVGGTFGHYGLDYSNSPSDAECAATCTADAACTAWVRQPSTGNCWISNQAVVTFEADSDRTTGLRCS